MGQSLWLMVGRPRLAVTEDMSQGSAVPYGLASICLHVWALVLLLATSSDARKALDLSGNPCSLFP